MNLSSSLFRLLAALGVAISFTACGAMRSARPEDAAKVIRIADQYGGGKAKKLPASTMSRKPLKAGQWAATLTRSKKDPNEVTLQIFKVVTVSGTSVTLESELYGSENGAKRVAIQQTIRNYPAKAPLALEGEEAAKAMKSMQIESVRMMDENGQVTALPQLPFGMMGLASELFKPTVASGSIRNEPCSGQAYESSRCVAVPFRTRVLWMTDSGTIYAHSAVPVLGFVKSDSASYDVQTIGFGESGAKILID